MSDTREKCLECSGRGTDEWGGTCIGCGGQAKQPFREWGKEDDEDVLIELSSAECPQCSEPELEYGSCKYCGYSVG